MSRSILRERVFGRKESVPGGVRSTARVGVLRSIKSLSLGIAVMFAAGVIIANLDNAPRHPNEQWLEVWFFPCFLLAIGIVVFLHGVIRFRNRLNALILKDTVVVEQIGLLKKTVVWNPGQGEQYSVIVSFRDHDHIESGGPDCGDMQRPIRVLPNVRVASLDIVDGNANRHRLVHKFNGWTAIVDLARTLSETLNLPPPAFVDLDENSK